jgi:hypothetical protein
MPKVGGKDIISETTEKTIRRLVVISAVTALVKLYSVPLNDLKVLGVDLPATVFDVVSLALILYFLYSLVINWAGDLAAFRLWYRESSLWSEFGTQIKLDKTFLQGGLPLLKKLYHLEKNQQWPSEFAAADDETKREYQDFKTNVELFILRLEHAGTKFRTLSWFGHYYVWVQSFLIPVGLSTYALYLLFRYGHIIAPPRM